MTVDAVDVDFGSRSGLYIRTTAERHLTVDMLIERVGWRNVPLQADAGGEARTRYITHPARRNLGLRRLERSAGARRRAGRARECDGVVPARQ
jgi:hypothetical protein